MPALYSFDGEILGAPTLRGRMTFAFSFCLSMLFNATWVERLLKTVRGDRQSAPRVPLPVPLLAGSSRFVELRGWVGSSEAVGLPDRAQDAGCAGRGRGECTSLAFYVDQRALPRSYDQVAMHASRRGGCFSNVHPTRTFTDKCIEPLYRSIYIIMARAFTYVICCSHLAQTSSGRCALRGERKGFRNRAAGRAALIA